MVPNNNSVKTVHQNPLLDIESNLDLLELLSPTHGKRSQQQIGRIALLSVLINKFLKALPCRNMEKNIPGSIAAEALSW